VVLVLAVAAGMIPDLSADSPECTFPHHITCDVGDHPVSVAVGDLDGVLGLDLAVANRDTDNVSVRPRRRRRP
jgi:hypothetical protein